MFVFHNYTWFNRYLISDSNERFVIILINFLNLSLNALKCNKLILPVKSGTCRNAILIFFTLQMKLFINHHNNGFLLLKSCIDIVFISIFGHAVFPVILLNDFDLL